MRIYKTVFSAEKFCQFKNETNPRECEKLRDGEDIQ